MHHYALTSHGTNPQPVEKTLFFDGLADGAFGSSGRPLWSPAPDMPAAWTVGRDKPVPYDRCSLRVRAPAPGW